MALTRRKCRHLAVVGASTVLEYWRSVLRHTSHVPSRRLSKRAHTLFARQFRFLHHLLHKPLVC